MKWLLMLFCSAVLAGCILLTSFDTLAAKGRAADACGSGDGSHSDNELWTTRSWDLFNRQDYQGAAANVNACLDNWSGAAEQLQADMDASRRPCPPVGAVPPGGQPDIHNNGVLNDVATNLWILGRSQQALGNQAAARKAYLSCSKLRCARTWDPRGWFWDPAAACTGLLK